MAQFEGTIKEFTKFIGAYARIKVMHMAAKHKKEIGKCEECGISNSLHAAHIKGKERPVLIANILRESIENNIIRIDLNDFEQRLLNRISQLNQLFEFYVKIATGLTIE